MFFASKLNVGFDDMRDVIRSYPEWELKVLEGAEAKIATLALAGDDTVNEFYKRDLEDPKNTRFQKLDEGMHALLQEQVIEYA